MRKKLRHADSVTSSSSAEENIETGVFKPHKKYWQTLPWKPVDVASINLGSFDDSVFFGLEEIDGNSYIVEKNKKNSQTTAETSETEGESTNKKKNKKNPKKRSLSEDAAEEGSKKSEPAKKKKKKVAAIDKQEKVTDVVDSTIDLSQTKKWDKVQLSFPIVETLQQLDFLHPTPIQSSSIPLTLSSSEINDIVGIAETGSGKTLVSLRLIWNFFV
jgi:hypothetical protein